MDNINFLKIKTNIKKKEKLIKEILQVYEKAISYFIQSIIIFLFFIFGKIVELK